LQVIENTQGGLRNLLSPHTPLETSGAVAPRKSQSRKGRVRRRAGHRIKASAAKIFWSLHPQTNRVTDVWVSSTDQPTAEFTREYFSPRWGFVVGNCDVAWLRHPAFTPEAVFGQLIKLGFHSSAELINALRQFAKINTCKWALPMLVRLGCAP
jgi:hypothetical protein